MRRPSLIVVSGINGAGKTTFADRLAASRRFMGMEALNADRLSAEYRETDASLSREIADLRGLRTVAETVDLYLRTQQSFVTETVGAGAAYRRIVSRARASGFFVRVFFIGLPAVEDSIERVALRVAKGGHSIPEDDIRRRWPAVHQNLEWFARHANVLDVYSNAVRRAAPVKVARVLGGVLLLLDEAALPEVTRALAALPRR